MSRVFASQDTERPVYHGRIISRIEKQPRSMLGVMRRLENGELRLEPVDRRQPELIIDPQYATTEVKPSDLVDTEIRRDQRYGLKHDIVREVVAHIGDEKALSMIVIAAHGIQHIFSPTVLKEAERAKPAQIGRA